jgi:hypothetical protein
MNDFYKTGHGNDGLSSDRYLSEMELWLRFC